MEFVYKNKNILFVIFIILMMFSQLIFDKALMDGVESQKVDIDIMYDKIESQKIRINDLYKIILDNNLTIINQ